MSTYISTSRLINQRSKRHISTVDKMAHDSKEIDILRLSSDECFRMLVNFLQETVHIHESAKRDTKLFVRRNSFTEYMSDAVISKIQTHPPFVGSDSAQATEKHHIEAVDLYKFFWLANAPQISLADYLFRFHRYCVPSPATYISIGTIIYNLTTVSSIIPLTERNVFRVFIGAFMVSSKAIEDNLRSMKRYAAIAGISKADLAQLELTTLLLLDYSIPVDHNSLTTGLSKWTNL